MLRGSARPKHVLSFSIFVLMTIVMSSATQPAYADSTQTYASVNLQYFTIQVEYPSVALPGATVQVQVQAVAKSSANLNNLTANVPLRYRTF